MSLPAGPGPKPAVSPAVAAAQRIVLVHGQVQHFARLAEAQVMESAWVIRRNIPDRRAFDAFVAAEAPVLAPDKAWLMADAWEAARRNRGMRELVDADPAAAIDFVRSVVEAGAEERLAALDDDDREFLDLARLPRRRRNEQLRKLLDVARVVDEGRDPVREELEQMARERDEAKQALASGGDVESLSSHPQARLRDAAGELQEIEKSLAPLAERIEGLIAATEVPDAVRRRLVATGDLLMGALERIAAAALEDGYVQEDVE